MEDPRRSLQVFQAVVGIVTVAAVTLLLLTEHSAPAIGVGLAGVLLIGFIAVVERRVIPGRRGTWSVADQRRNLALVLKLGHALTAIGLVMIAVGAILTLTDIGGDVAHALLTWAGPHTVIGGLGAYTGHGIVRRELATSSRPE